MTAINIRAGLRRLDFTVTDKANDSGERHVVVEFMQPTQLARDQVVQINLGIRDGLVRMLHGMPVLQKAVKSGQPREFLYRLEGHVG
jgi:hypothetical protein